MPVTIAIEVVNSFSAEGEGAATSAVVEIASAFDSASQSATLETATALSALSTLIGTAQATVCVPVPISISHYGATRTPIVGVAVVESVSETGGRVEATIFSEIVIGFSVGGVTKPPLPGVTATELISLSSRLVPATIFNSAVVTASSGSLLTTPLPGIAALNPVNSAYSREFAREFDDSLVVRDLTMLNGIIPLLVEDDIAPTDEITPSGVKFLLELADEFGISEEVPQIFTFGEKIKLFDECVLKHYIEGETYTVNGSQWVRGSENLCANSTIHLIKRYMHPWLLDFVAPSDEVELEHVRAGEVLSTEIVPGGSEPGLPEGEKRDLLPKGNATEYRTVSDENGFFQMVNVPEGVYTIVSIKEGHAIGLQRLDLRADSQIDLTMYPLEAWDVVERPFNVWGHFFKVYFYNNVIYGDYRVVDGLIVFGDLYGTGANVPAAPNDGYLNVIDRYTLGKIAIIDTPFLGRNGFFEPDSETLEINEDQTEITWNSISQKGDFDGFCFRYVFHKAMTGVLNLSLASPIPAPFPGASGGGGGGGGGSSSSGGSGSSGGGGGGSGGGGSGGGGGGGGSISQPGIPSSYPAGDPPVWNPEFALHVSERLAIKDADCAIDVLRGGSRIRMVDLYDGTFLLDSFTTPPRLSMTGRACGKTTQTVTDPDTGDVSTVEVDGDPIVGALVTIKARRNNRIVAETSTDNNGMWRVSNLESELVYDVLISETENPAHYPISGTVQVFDRDVIDERARTMIESESYRGERFDRYMDVRIILPPMETRLDNDGRVYGLITDSITGEPVLGALVEVYPGHLTEDELVAYGGQIYSFRTFDRDYVNSGFYEVYLPKGDYTVRAVKNGYVISDPYHVSIRSGWEQNIPMIRSSVTGTVYDGNDYGAGILTPVPYATITFNGVSATSQADGSYVVTAEVVAGNTYDVSCSKLNHITVVKSVTANAQFIEGVNFFLWGVHQYSGKR